MQRRGLHHHALRLQQLQYKLKSAARAQTAQGVQCNILDVDSAVGIVASSGKQDDGRGFDGEDKTHRALRAPWQKQGLLWAPPC